MVPECQFPRAKGVTTVYRHGHVEIGSHRSGTSARFALPQGG